MGIRNKNKTFLYSKNAIKTRYEIKYPLKMLQYLEANGHDSSTDLLSHHELFPQHGQDQILPAAGCQAFTKPDDPFASTLISIVLETILERDYQCSGNQFESFCIPVPLFFKLILKGELSCHTHLPHGLDPLLKQVEIAVACQIARSDHVTIKTPELLHLQ